MEQLHHLHLDIETYSPVSLPDCGVYRYAASEDFRILLISYAWDDEPTQIIDMEHEADINVLYSLLQAIKDPSVRKHAHNATFERVCFTHYMRRQMMLKKEEWLDPLQWDCSMVQCARCGLPLTLDQAGAALKLTEQKMQEGKALIRLFCLPDKTGRRVTADEFPDKWETFKAYCVRDVDVEREIEKRTSWYHVSPEERELYAIDQRINDAGVRINRAMVENAVFISEAHKAALTMEAVRLTGLSNPNSLPQLKSWLEEQTGTEFTSLNKEDIKILLKNPATPERVKRMLRIRAQVGKTSNEKYAAMLDTAGEDDRIRGLLQFHGSRTGRWAGRLVQMQNLPQNHIDDLDLARELVVAKDREMLSVCYGNVPDTLSQLIRTAFEAPAGKTFAVCDFSAIEARVIAWLAGENWVLDVFREGGDIYCETASQMFHVPVRKHGENAELRQKGKIAVLGLGYGGGVNALENMGGSRLGLTPSEEQDIVTRWRESNPHIVALWSALETAARNVTTYKIPATVNGLRIEWETSSNTMTIQLPSGRKISYPKMGLRKNHFAKMSLQYMGVNQETKKYEWVDTYGGKITENVVQAIARDCLAEVMRAAAKEGFKMVFHVHDEIIVETDSEKDLQKIEEIFARPISWAPGLPLKGAGYTTPYYKKD